MLCIQPELTTERKLYNQKHMSLQEMTTI